MSHEDPPTKPEPVHAHWSYEASVEDCLECGDAWEDHLLTDEGVICPRNISGAV